jgi:hypothetical protein
LAQWRVHLQGKQFDLDELREILANNDPTIIQDDSNYYLISAEWNQSHDSTDIHNRAKEFVGLLENAAYLDSNETAPFSVGGTIRIDDDGRKHHFLVAERGDYVMVGERARLILTPNNVPVENIEEHSLIKTLRVSMRSAVVSDALRFYRQGDWFGLYKAYELVSDDVGGKREILSRKWISESTLNRFGQMAQSREVLGDDARHASRRFKPPANPMSLPAAKEVIATA